MLPPASLRPLLCRSPRKASAAFAEARHLLMGRFQGCAPDPVWGLSGLPAAQCNAMQCWYCSETGGQSVRGREKPLSLSQHSLLCNGAFFSHDSGSVNACQAEEEFRCSDKMFTSAGTVLAHLMYEVIAGCWAAEWRMLLGKALVWEPHSRSPIQELRL